MKPRRLSFSKDRRNLLVTSRRIHGVKGLWKAAVNKNARSGSVRVIALHWMDRFDRGSISPRFFQLEASADPEFAREIAKYVTAEQCLFVVYTSAENSLESLDLLVPDKKDYKLLVTALDDLMFLARKELQNYTANMQFLHFHWMCLGKEWESLMSLAEWIVLTEKTQSPVRKQLLTSMFKEECTDAHDEKLPISTIALLLEELREEATEGADPLHRLWKELVHTDPVPVVGMQANEEDVSVELGIREQSYSISAVAFLSFIRSQQKNYTATMEQVTDFVRTLNSHISGEPANDVPVDRLSRSRFLSWLTSDANDLIIPERASIGADDMTKPLSHYWINTSHDTFLAGAPNSFGDKSAFSRGAPVDVDAYMYTAALLRGVRCLEFDVWDDASANEPVIAMRQDSKSMPLRTVLRSVRYFLNENPYTFPIILKVENHCSPAVQMKMANLFYEHFGAAKLIVRPLENQELYTQVDLPSPESCRGMVLILGKRPKKMKVGCTFINDDLDDDAWQVVNPTVANRVAAYYDEIEDAIEVEGAVIGFDTKGPIRSRDADSLKRSPADLLQIALADAKKAATESEAAATVMIEASKKADAQERLTAHLTLEAGVLPKEIKERAAKAVSRGLGFDADNATEEKNSKDEGLEVHEILPGMVEGNQDSYAEAAHQSMQAAQKVASRLAELRAAERALEQAESDLQMSRQLEQNGVETAKRAAAEARMHQEHADAANERVEKVKELLRDSEVHVSSAGTVVQTALTEAKISEKRATDAEIKASRALSTAEKDRTRADEETRKEEEMEHEVSDLRLTYQEASESSQAARARLDKANAMFDRVNEQIKLIENSSKYRTEKEQNQGEVSSVRHGGSFLAKHEAKIEERTTCRELIKEASEERAAADARLIMLKSKFEERARAWKVQANVAAQARRTADRSAQIAEEHAEHADEERNAAQLRQVAREKAVETVENRDSQRVSVEAQLAQAERAAIEAADLAAQSRIRAQKLDKELEKIQDHRKFIQNVAQRKLNVKQAQSAYDSAKEEKQMKDKAAHDEKRCLDTNSSVYRSATRDLATEVDRAKVVKVLQDEAIAAYNTAIVLRRQAESASTKSEIAASIASSKKEAAEHAKEYKERRDMLIEIPGLLAKLTLLHSAKFLDWRRSLLTTKSFVHSFAHNVFLQIFEKDSTEDRANVQAFTTHHLCRVFPSWKVVQSNASVNFDPVPAWSLGCQLVAMNFQSSDENILVADGRFRQNGSCGYVLKPRQLTDKSYKAEHPQFWTFTVLGGFNLPKVGRKVINPCVKVSFCSGLPKETRQIYKTKFAGYNGLNPAWGKGDGVTFEVTNPSIAIVAFSVWSRHDDKSETFVAGAAVPVSCLREGYRSISLFSGDHSRTGSLRYASLLVKATKR